LLWRVPTKEKKIYLTFDDGPVPEITPWVLDVLKSFTARASFFVVGENVIRHPDLFRRIAREGHRIGNHTYNHLKGWKTADKVYLENIEQCFSAIEKEWPLPGDKSQGSESEFPPEKEGRLFRPPYGRMRKSQIRQLNTKIVMWDVLSYDFDALLNPVKCLKKVLRSSREGSVVVFHDNVKAKRNLEYVLPRFLEEFADRGFSFEAL
jgi:peptidoglycan/xylan/chitin deacetylase (PgdA/CDA1 family)